MNERTHNPMEVYKKNKNSNSNNNTREEEFATEFDAKQKRAAPNQLSNKK